jgi:hypothetical protein
VPSSREPAIVYAVLMTALKAHVVNGRIVVDEPVDLRLERALDRSLAQADAKELVDADEVLAELQRR